jgi:nitrite reductase/ring-hydroxylating ferredoxin subunit
MAATTYRRLMDADALGVGESREISVEGRDLLLVRSARGYFVLSARCSHAGQPLQGGRVIGDSIVCPHHGARFDLRTGRPGVSGFCAPVGSYPARVVAARVEVLLPSADHREAAEPDETADHQELKE